MILTGRIRLNYFHLDLPEFPFIGGQGKITVRGFFSLPDTVMLVFQDSDQPEDPSCVKTAKVAFVNLVSLIQSSSFGQGLGQHSLQAKVKMKVTSVNISQTKDLMYLSKIAPKDISLSDLMQELTTDENGVNLLCTRDKAQVFVDRRPLSVILLWKHPEDQRFMVGAVKDLEPPLGKKCCTQG